ncbi:DNA integrity scanning protein DisA [Planctomycetes bacterium MalM25]|nr:DNA integrity scanning protein DisA [Planctomycetes bacterium MalM25]
MATTPRRFTAQLKGFCAAAAELAEQHSADAVLFLAERPVDWSKLQSAVGSRSLLIAADSEDQLAGAHDDENGPSLETILLGMNDAPVYERLTQALIEAVSEELLEASATVVTLHSSFDPGVIDSISLIRLEEHLGRLTVRDLRQIESKVPTKTLKLVIDLAVEIGREGREGKPVGALFVVGDHRKTLDHCKPMGFDPVKGYTTAERSLTDSKVREGVKEIAQMDGAFVVSNNATVVASAQHLSSPASKEITLSKGLGARHWAAAQISRATDAIAVAISSSGGTVRVFQGGEVVLRVEPLRRAMTWRDFEAEHDEKETPPAKAKSSKAKSGKSKSTKSSGGDTSAASGI